MNRDYNLFLKDVLDCIVRVEEFVNGLSYEDFVGDDKTSSAVIRKFEIIGEVVKHIPNEITEKYKNIPWSDMAKMRDKIIHFYFGIDYEIVWKSIKDDLPLIKKEVMLIIEDKKF